MGASTMLALGLHADGLGARIYSSVTTGEISGDSDADLLVRSFLAAGIDTTINGISVAIGAIVHDPISGICYAAIPAWRATPSMKLCGSNHR